MSFRALRNRRAVVLIALTAAVASQVGAGAATAAPTWPGGSTPLVDTQLSADQIASFQDAVERSRTQAALPQDGAYSFFLTLDAKSSGRAYTDASSGGTDNARQAARAAKTAIGRLQAAAERGLPAGSRVLYRTSAAAAGVAIMTDVRNFSALFNIPGVVAVNPISPKVATNAGVAELINAPEVWESLGDTGQGIDVGVIDTGIDYTHTDFGGSGSVAQYNLLTRLEDRPAPRGVFPNEKVVGGTDFVGNDYDPGNPANPGHDVPQPDPNPLDCNGHGSHVSGTAAGYGVNDDGSTYTGPYTTDVDLKALRIGPGMAPEANLWALKVFGCEGSTNVLGAALEYALDPNGDGSPDDHLDVVNGSLGSSFGIPEDADGILAGSLQAQGVMMVFSIGNSGDVYDVGGSPGNFPAVMGVAASDDGYSVFDGWEIVNQPDLFDPDVRPGLRSVLYEGSGDITAPLTLPVAGDDPTACTPLSGDYTGEVLVIQADGFVCGSITKSANAKAAGAAGFVIISDDDSLESGINGDPDIPGILVRASDGAVLVDELEQGTELIIHFGDSLAGAAQVDDPAAVDTLASFSSRGTRESVKPDVTAPGVNTVSAGVGTGDDILTISGTSMASPVVAGVSALVRHENPSWTTAQVKADIMNTAVHDISTEPNQSGWLYGPNRVGSGRVDAEAALNNKVLAYEADSFSVVSATFGVVEVSEPTQAVSKTITVDNQGDTDATYNLTYRPITAMPGVRYTLSTESVTVAAGTTAQFDITLTATRDRMRKTIDPTVSPTQADVPRQYVADASGRINLTPATGEGTVLRVPVHANPKPISELTQNAFRTGGNTGVVQLDGRGVDNGYYGYRGSYVSTASAFSLLGTSGTMPICGATREPSCINYEGERGVDLATVGVTSDAAIYGADNSTLYFGVGLHGEFTAPAAFTNYSVYIDATGDGEWDYQLLTTRFYDGADPLDVPVVIGADRDGNLLPSNDAPAVTFLNAAPGSLDTNIFDANFVIMPFPTSALAELSGRFSFGVQSTNGFGAVDNLGTVVTDEGAPELAAETMSYDAFSPSLSFNLVDYQVPGILVPSADDTQIRVRADYDSYQADQALGGPKGIMVIHTHNTSEQRVQTITLTAGGGDVFAGL